MDIHLIKLQQFVDEINTNPCPFCKKMHHAEFDYEDLGAMHGLDPHYSDDACDKFREYANRRAAGIVQWYNAPLKDLP